jgi:hypothetical protein
MAERLFLARMFLISGVLLVAVSLVLWFVLPIPMMFPPYLATALLALGYGAFCLRDNRRPPGVGKS